MMVVAAIIAVIVGISFPAASAGLDSIRLTSATQSVATFINGALNRAERRQEAVQLVISPRDNRMTLYSAQPGYMRELKLPDGIFLEAVLPPRPDDPDPVRRFILMPNATAPAIGIQIANEHGSRRIVRLDPLTGFPRVESVGKK
jgi:type II secretory pathway pseudopilin PulG